MEAKAIRRKLPYSPRKTRLVADLVRGMKAEGALRLLSNYNKQAAKPIHDLLKSAISNWHHAHQSTSPIELYIKSIWVDGGQMLKRISTAAQGRAHRIRRRYCHITLTLASKEVDKKPSPRNAKKHE